jgi:diguanylate cyclase (GGDEF)-like protein
MTGDLPIEAHGGTAALDLTLCELEPIHTPGSIQPHGAVVVALADGLLVTHVSANLEAILGRPAETALGQPLRDVIGEAACSELRRPGVREGIAAGYVSSLPGSDHGSADLRAYPSGRRLICVDIEPIRPAVQQKSPMILTQSVLETFKHTSTQVELCELAVVGLRAITGFNRVMAYRFHDEGYGEVIAEARGARLEPYLGLRYPASDIPAQARRLYLRQRVGTIADVDYQPVPLLVDRSLDDGTPVDLTHSALRSASPVHREYMRNMGTAASLTIGLVHTPASGERKLWGMLVCHNSKPMIAGPELRAVAEMLGQVVSLLLGSLGDSEVHSQRFERQMALSTLVGRLADSMSPAVALTGAEEDILRLVDAAGAVLRIGKEVHRLGQAPPLPVAEQALAVLLPLAGNAVLAVDDLGKRHPELADCTAKGSGALLLPLGLDSADAIVWFRPELSRTVTWGGKPDEHVTPDPATGQLRPRNSFMAWREIVSGRSEPWTEADLGLAREFRSVFDHAAAQRIRAELARLRYYDPLTGLPNRSLLNERLIEAQRDTETSTALLFLDLDRFKAVNDTMGHAAGDALLIEVTRRLIAVAGPDQLTARLGGDEFVVLCRGLDQNAIADLGERVRTVIEAPYEIAGRPCNISASIGIAVAERLGGLDLVEAADTAMYAAKHGGGNRGVVFDPSLSDDAVQQAELTKEMRLALSAGDQFVLLYQPLFRIAGGRRHLAGFEALLRWQHPRHSTMLPDQFLPLACKSGLIHPLGEWVLANALRQGCVFRNIRKGGEMRLAMNVAVVQLQAGFCAGLAGALEAEGFPPAELCLEVTDNILGDVAAAFVLAEIRKLGVRVAIDDFGIVHLAPSYLRLLQVDEVKLDRRFLEDVEGDARGKALIGAVIALAHAASMPVVFEGVETVAEADIALGAGAEIVQGFYFSPPLTASDAEQLVAQYCEAKSPRSDA